MIFKWIFEEREKNKLELLAESFVKVDYEDVRPGYSINDMFKYDNTTECLIPSNKPHSVNLSFSKLYYIAAYKLQILATKRYMTGWRIDTSIDGTYFTPLDIRNENLCFSDYIHDVEGDKITDCRNLTTREFATQKTRFKYLNLVMTKKDSCGSGYQLQLSLFDLFVSPVTDFSNESLCIIKSIFLYISLLFS